MIYSVIILCGGKGSRSEDPSKPKILQKIGPDPILKYIVKAFDSSDHKIQLIFVGGWKSEFILNDLETLSHEFSNLEIEFVVESNPSGTTNAVKLGLEKSKSDVVMVVMGDLFIPNSLIKYFKIFESSNSDLMFLSHPNNHPQDSDLVRYNSENLQVNEIILKNSSRSLVEGNMAISGVLVASSTFLSGLDTVHRDLIEAMTFTPSKSQIKIVTFPIIDPIHDIGTPTRVERMSKLHKRLTSRKFNSALFVDLDNTLIPNLEVKNKNSRFSLSEDIARALSEFSELDVPIFIVTNQPGIAKGFFSWSDFDDFREKFESELVKFDAYISRWFVCPHHPESGFAGENISLKIECLCRKPGAKFAELAKIEYNLSLEDSWMVGDNLRDLNFALNASLQFIGASVDGLNLDKTLKSTSKALQSLVSYYADN